MVLEQFIIDADIIWDQVGKTFFENPEAKPGRVMRVQVVNAGIIEDLTGYTLNLGWTSVRDPSKFGLDAFDDVDITKGIFEIEYTSGMLTNIGPLNASLQLVPPGLGRPIESNNFKLTVKNSAINPEAIQGETSFSTLENALVEVNRWNARIDVVEQEFKDRADALDGTYPVRLNAVEQQSLQAATKADAMASGSPKGVYATLALLQAAYPTGTTGAYLVSTDGNWYYWSGLDWVSGGIYQSTIGTASNTTLMDSDNLFEALTVEDALRESSQKMMDSNGYLVKQPYVTISQSFNAELLGAEVAPNRLFENWADGKPVGWGVNLNSSTVTMDSINKFSGKCSAKLTTGATHTTYSPCLYVELLTLTPLSTYSISLIYKGDGVNAGAMGLYDNTASLYLGGTIPNLSKDSVWKKETRLFTVPAGCNKLTVYLFGNLNVTGAVINFDSISIKPYTIVDANNTPIPVDVALRNLPASTVKYRNVGSDVSSDTVQNAITELSTIKVIDASRVKATLDVDYVADDYGIELFTNTSMEDWTTAVPVGYSTAVESGTVTKETSIVHSGFLSAKLTKGTATAWYTPQLAMKKTVLPLTTYSVSFYTRGDGSNAGVFGIYDGVTYLVPESSTGVPGTGWTKVTRTVTTGATASYLMLFMCPPNVLNAIAYYDDVSVRQITSSNRNGLPTTLQSMLSKLPSSAVKYDNAASGLPATNVKSALDELTLRAAGTAKLNVDYFPSLYGVELFTNGGLEDWTSYYPTGWGGSSSGLEKSLDAHTGTYAIKVTHKVDGASYEYQAEQNKIVIPGNTYELSFWAKGDGTRRSMYAIFDNTHGTYIVSSTSVGSATEWSKITSRIVIPSGCVSLKVWFFSPGANGSYSLIDDVSFKNIDVGNKNGIMLPLQTLLDNFPAEAVKFDNIVSGFTGTNVQDIIYELQSKYGNVASKVTLNLPDKYDLVVGDTFELFYKGIIMANDPYIYNIKITCSKGAQFSKRFIYTPVVGDIGTHTMTISIYDDNENLLSTKSTSLVVKAKASNPSTIKTVLNVGDSLTSGGAWPAELHHRLVEVDGLSNLSFIGTKIADGNVGYEGYGGWTYDTFTTNYADNSKVWVNVGSHDKDASDQWSIYQDANGAQWKIETIEPTTIKMIRTSGTTAMPTSGTLTWVSGGVHTTAIVFSSTTAESGNPFWNETLGADDFANYAAELGVSSIDYVNILLGWNSTGSDETTYKGKIRNFINLIRAAFPNAKISLMGLQVPSLDGFGANYGCSWNYYDKLKFVFNLDKWHKDICAEYTGIDYVNIAGQFDSENNVLTGTRTVNVRNSKTETYGTNGVHPDITGYYQIADAMYRNMNNKLV